MLVGSLWLGTVDKGSRTLHGDALLELSSQSGWCYCSQNRFRRMISQLFRIPQLQRFVRFVYYIRMKLFSFAC